MSNFKWSSDMRAAVVRARRLNQIMSDLHSATDRELKELMNFYEAQVNRATRERLAVICEIDKRRNVVRA